MLEKFLLITGGGTYSIRDKIKQRAGTWNPLLQAWIVPMSQRHAIEPLCRDMGLDIEERHLDVRFLPAYTADAVR